MDSLFSQQYWEPLENQHSISLFFLSTSVTYCLPPAAGAHAYFFLISPNYSAVRDKKDTAQRMEGPAQSPLPLHPCSNGTKIFDRASYKDIALLLTVFPLPYILSTWLIYFITGSLHFFIFLPFLTHSIPAFLLATTCLLFQYETLFLFLCLLFFIFPVSEIIWYLSDLCHLA